VSDTLIYLMAKIGADDGRPMIVLYFSDCDPSGWNMPIEGRPETPGVQGMPYPGLEFEVHRVALTPDQVHEYHRPSTPLTDTERRGDKWQAAIGVEQTEIDALASLRPNLLRDITRNAIAPFFDDTLVDRIFNAQSNWLEAAQNIVDENTDQVHLDRLRTEAEGKLAELAEQIHAINDALQLDVRGFNLSAIEIPTADVDYYLQPNPLLDSWWSFTEQCKALIDSKAYRLGGAS
jgi:hypothetical protein